MASFTTLQELIASLARGGPETALVGFQKERMQSYTFAELADLARRLGRGLLDAGLEPGSRVVIFAPNQAEWILVCLALISAKAVPVPIDAQIGREELQHILRECGGRWACTTANLARRLDETETQLNYILLDGETRVRPHWRGYLADSTGSLPTSSPQDLALLFYTSGTSGQPKGVPLTHKNLTSNLNALLGLGLIRPDDRLLLPLPLHHVYPFTFGMLAPLAAGVPIILPGALTGKEFLRAIQEGDVTAIIGVPRLYGAFYEAIESSLRARGLIASGLFHGLLAISVSLRKLGLRAGDYLFAALRKRIAPRLRVLASGGSATEPALAWRLEGLGWQVVSGYGLTETSPILTFNTPGKERVGSAGRPLPGVEIRISLPDEGMQFGEVLARGPNVFSGYWDMPEKNAEAFTAEGYFRTGDLGYIDSDGYLHLMGRASSMIVLAGGENIQPENVESALERSPYIREAGVLATKDRLIALVVPDAQAQAQSEPIEDLIRREVQRESSKLPSHHRVTDYAITEEPLPRTRIGKIRRHMLPERFEHAKSGKEKKAVGAVPAEQWSPEDQELLENATAQAVWDWLPSHFPDARLAPETNLQLDLGIDSLDWLNITLEMRAVAGAELDEAAIGRIETVRDLLRETAAAGSATLPQLDLDPLEKLQRPEELLNQEQRRWLEPRPLFIRILGSCLLALNRGLMRSLFRLRVRGEHRLPQKGPFILTPNHASYLDPLAVGAALPRHALNRTYWGGWTAVMFANPLMRLVSRAVRVMPIDPKGGPLSSVAFAVAAVKQGYNLTWFPEGGRSPDGKLKRFRPGIGLAVSAQPVPLVPVWIDGAYEALPLGKRIPRLRTITITFGEPVAPKELQPDAREKLPYQAIADALHERVASLQTIVKSVD
jgi:long-chain acyl-CoA synthetase